MSYLLLLRHGESLWNKENLFTGWVDVPLSEKGIEEAVLARKELAKYDLDVVFCSSLVRAMMTAMISLVGHPSKKTPVVQHTKEEGLMYDWSKIYSEATLKNVLPVFTNSAINERMYGALQGLNKKETADKYGKEQVQEWRRSYRTRPPEGESLEMTLQRTLPYFTSTIEPCLQEGKNVLVSAHGNSLRAIIKHLENVSEEAIVGYELATGVPIVYSYENKMYKKVG